MDEMTNIRGAKEIINGRLVDDKGVHLDQSHFENILMKVAAGEEVSPEEAVSPSGETVKEDDFVIDDKGCHFDKDSLVSSLASLSSLPKMTVKSSGKQKKAESIDFGIYQPIWDELQKIPLSKDSYEADIKALAGAIKEASKEIKIRRIVANTQSIAKNAQNFYYSEGGMRTVFSILGNRFSMIVRGELSGSEAFYIQVNGDNVEGIVLKKEENGDFADVTKNFQVHIKREQ
jgi:hypothetical protein